MRIWSLIQNISMPRDWWRGFLKIVKFDQEVITVTGSAQKDIKNDKIVWKSVRAISAGVLSTGRNCPSLN